MLAAPATISAVDPTPAAPAQSEMFRQPGDTRANNSMNALDAAGRTRAIYKAPAGARTHLIIDLAGYFR